MMANSGTHQPKHAWDNSFSKTEVNPNFWTSTPTKADDPLPSPPPMSDEESDMSFSVLNKSIPKTLPITTDTTVNAMLLQTRETQHNTTVREQPQPQQQHKVGQTKQIQNNTSSTNYDDYFKSNYNTNNATTTSSAIPSSGNNLSSINYHNNTNNNDNNPSLNVTATTDVSAVSYESSNYNSTSSLSTPSTTTTTTEEKPTQFSALTFWNGLKQHVANMTLSNKRRRLKKYRNSASGKEITSHVHSYLKIRDEHKYKNASRLQCQQICDMLMNQDLIHPAHGTPKFKDSSSHLYHINKNSL